MDLITFEKFHAEGLISDRSLEKVRKVETGRLFSLYWELKTLLYLGVSLLSTGLGILVYKHIDSIGHPAVLTFIALVSVGCFVYCLRKKLPYSPLKVASPDAFFDYILLLACLTFVTFIGYLQYQYAAFGNAYSLETGITMIVLFICAYFFDHLGVLSLAITNLGAWLGISVTPMRILEENAFDDPRLIYTGLGLAVLLILAGLFSERRNIKQHFAFTYANFGTHLLFISGLAGLFLFNRTYLLWFLLLLGAAYYVFRQAMQRRSFYFLLVVTLYMYIALSYVVIQLLFYMSIFDTAALYLAFLYFILSAILVVRGLMTLNRKMKADDRLR